MNFKTTINYKLSKSPGCELNKFIIKCNSILTGLHDLFLKTFNFQFSTFRFQNSLSLQKITL